MTDAPNAGQIEYWNGAVGQRWSRLQTELDAVFVEVTGALMAAAAPRIGDRVVDIGCGCGGSIVALTSFVGPTGHVLGLDISEPMLDVARTRIAAGHIPNAGLLLADAATHVFDAGSADLAFSRFGVMFFDAPAKAFANIRTALKPDGRLAFVCWRPFKDNPFFAVPYWAAKPHLPPDAMPTPDPDAPSPFAFADADKVRRILDEAGFHDIAVEPSDVALPLAASGEIDKALGFISQIGPVARALGTVEPAERKPALAAIREALKDFDTPDGIAMPARLWVVTAKT